MVIYFAMFRRITKGQLLKESKIFYFFLCGGEERENEERENEEREKEEREKEEREKEERE